MKFMRMGWGMAMIAILAVSPAYAGAALEVMPVVLDVAAPNATGTVTIRNVDEKPTSIQVRLFRWRQSGGEERYEATQDVVASPPFGNVAPGASLTVRVIRAASTPVQGEESYRLVLDQLPEADKAGRAKVSMLLRQVLPVFFFNPDRSPPQVNWSVAPGPKGLVLKAQNGGDQRLRVAEVTLSGAGKAPIKLGGGLLGYVLGHADMSWSLGKAAALPAGVSVALRGESDHGAFRATAAIAPAR